MEVDLGATLETLSNSVPRADSEYIGADGLTYCSVCNKPTQTRISVAELNINRVVRCICDCKKKELEEFENRKLYEERERRRRSCFAESNMSGWTFQNDDRRNSKLSDAMQRYVEDFADFKKEGKGLLLYGTVGTGKSYFAACIANGLIDNGRRVLMTNFARLTNHIQGLYDGKQRYIDSLNDYELLIIDDLGAERKSEFMQEMVFNIIDSRYRSGLPFIITTNLTAEEIKKPQEIGFSRIYDRILERCFPVQVSGESRRRQAVKDTYFDIKSKLGL